jgi:chromate reductase
MAPNHDVVVLVGSLRKGSWTRQTATALAALAPSRLKLRSVEIGDLALYNQDLDADHPPSSWVKFRDQVRPADAVLFATPEYNRSVPGVLKNAIDVGSRPYGKSVFDKKPAAVISVTGGALGAFGANHHLRQSLVFLNMPTMAQPEAYIGNAGHLYDENGGVKDEKVKTFLSNFIKAFGDWIDANAATPAKRADA